MAPRTSGSAVLALIACAIGCKGKDDATNAETPSGAADREKPRVVDLDQRCVDLGKRCGDTAKHVAKLSGECKDLAKVQVEKGCADKVNVAYDCYERELCNKSDKVWALGDLDVLAERHGKCVAERDAAASCAKK